MRSNCTRIIFAVLTAASGLLAPARASCSAPEIVAHHLEVTLDPGSHTLKGSDAIEVIPHEAASVSFRLGPAAKIHLVTWGKAHPPAQQAPANHEKLSSGHPHPVPARYTFQHGILTAEAPSDWRAEEPGAGTLRSEVSTGKLTLTIAYEMRFEDSPSENPLNTDDPSYGVKGVLSDRGVLLLPESGWYPESREGSSSFRIAVSAPAGIEAVTAGRRIEHRVDGGLSFSVWQIDRPLRGVVLSAGRYAIRETSAGDITVYTYFYPDSADLAGKYLSKSVEYLSLYSDLIGPYPFPKFAVVENFFPTGYGLPSWTLLGSSVIRLPFILDSSLGHEVAHSWFGNCVLVDPESGNWSEGLVNYIADYYYKERSSPAEAREYRLQILREYATLVPPDKDFPLSAFEGRVDPVTKTIGYGKGAMVFHMARRMAGEEPFWRGLREIYREKAFQAAVWRDFARAFSKTSGMDLVPFFEQWVDRPGAPFLSLTDVAREQSGTGWKVGGAIEQKEPHYALRVPVRLETRSGPIDTTVDLTGARAAIAIASEDRPLRLEIDPEADIFRRLHPGEVPPTVNTIRGSDSLRAILAAGTTTGMAERYKDLLIALGIGHTPLIREEAATPSDLTGHDLLFLGAPSPPLALQLPEDMHISADRFAVDGVSFDDKKDALFTVFGSPWSPQRSVAVFLPLSAEAAETCVRKIPHYGKYGSLVFREGVNKMKLLSPAKSPLMVTFPET